MKQVENVRTFWTSVCLCLLALLVMVNSAICVLLLNEFYPETLAQVYSSWHFWIGLTIGTIAIHGLLSLWQVWGWWKR